MFKKDDKVKVIKGIKAFEGLTGTVLDTNGSQVKVKLNMSEDAEVQKNIINIFEDYQLELESLDLLKEEAEATFDNEEEGINELIQDSIKSKKPVKIDPFSLEFKDINDSNPEMEYATKVIEKGTIEEDELGNPQWATQPNTSYWFPFTFKDFINSTKGIIDIYSYIEGNDDHKDSIYNLKPEEIVSIIQRLVKDSNQAKKVYEYLDEAAQKDCDEEYGSFPTEEAKEELLEFERDVRDAVKNGKWVKCGPFEVHFKRRYDSNPDLKYFKDGNFPYSLKMDFIDLINTVWGYNNPYDCLKEANIYDDPEEATLNPREILYLLNHLSDDAYYRLDEIVEQKYGDGYDRDWEPYYESLNSLKEEAEVAFDNDENEKQVCCICGEEYTGYGNNAEPYKEGRCCDECNRKFVIPSRLNKLRSAKNESLKLTEEELKAWCSDNDANYYTQDIKDDKVIIRGLKEDLAEYDFKTKELKVFDYSGTTTQEQDLEDDYDDNYIRDYVYDVDMLDDKEYPSWEFVSVIATAENISDDSVIEEAHNRGFKVFLIQASNYEKFVVAAEKITEEDIMEDFASYLEGNPKVTEIV